MSLVPLDPDKCPECDSTVLRMSVIQLPLLRGGGYGAAVREKRRTCLECGWSLVFETKEVRP